MPAGYLSGVSQAYRRTYSDRDDLGTWWCLWTDTPVWPPSFPLCLARVRMPTPESECTSYQRNQEQWHHGNALLAIAIPWLHNRCLVPWESAERQRGHDRGPTQRPTRCVSP